MKIKKPLQGLLCGILLLSTVCIGHASSYDFPIADPIKASIISTPPADRAALPNQIRVKQYLTIDVFPDRTVPEVFFYNKKLRYSVAYHKEKAPVMFLIAGTGAGYDSVKMKLLQKIFFQAGFHVVALSSPTHPNFIVAASSSYLPGDIRSDAEDIYNVMEKIWLQSKKKEMVGDFYLTGYSLGGSQAAFVAKLDEQRHVFNFRKVLMLNPALSSYDSAVKLDKMLEGNIPGGIDHFDEFYDKLISNITKSYVQGDFIDLSNDFFYSAYNQILPSPGEGKALIGFSFRISLANMLFTADVMTNSGYIVPKNLKLSRTDSLSNYRKVAGRVNGFGEYVDDILYPALKQRELGLSKAALISRSSLRSIEDYLMKSDKIGLVTNSDDFILSDGDIDYFKHVFGARAKIFPRGGHCGNLAYKDNVAWMINFFKSKQGVSK